MTGQEDAVGGQGEIVQRGLAAQQPHQLGEIVSQQRLAAGEPDLVHPETAKDAHQTIDLLEGEDRLARQPDVVLLGHAVAAAHVAAIGY